MKITKISLEIDQKMGDNDLKRIIGELSAIQGVQSVQIGIQIPREGGIYSMELPVPFLVSATIMGSDTSLPREEGSAPKIPAQVPVIGKPRQRPPVSQEWLIDKARRIHSAKDMIRFFTQYRRFATRNNLEPWFKQLCDERMVEIRKASFPDMETPEEPKILTEVFTAKDDAQIREDVVAQIKEIKGADFSLLDLFIDPRSGRIPYTEESKIPLDELVNALEAMMPSEESGILREDTEEDE